MRNGRTLVLGVTLGLAGLVSGCGVKVDGDPAPDPATSVVRGGEEIEGRLLIDLRDATRAWLFDGREGTLPLEETLLICPNGASMRLASWLSVQQTELGFDLGDARYAVFALAAEEERALSAAMSAAGCAEPECHQCPDGIWICACPGDGSLGTGTRDESTASGDGSQDIDDPFGYTEGSSSGSGSGSGSGSSPSGSGTGSGAGGESGDGQTPASQPTPDL